MSLQNNVSSEARGGQAEQEESLLPPLKKGKPPKGFIMRMSDNEVMYFQINPIPLNKSYSVEYEELESPGSSHPIHQFTRGNSNEYTFDIELNDRFSDCELGHTKQFLNFMKNLLPQGDYQDPFRPPPTITIGLGDNFTETCVLKNFDVEEHRLHPETLDPIAATVSVTVNTVGRDIT